VPGRPHLSVSSGRNPHALPARLAVLLVVPFLAACSAGTVEISTPDLDDTARAACEAFTADLPESIYEETRREVEPADALGGAYGDPAIVVRCGVAVPADFDEAVSSCEVANDVGWYVPPAEFDDQEADVTLTAAGYRPVVEVSVPGSYRPNGTAAAIAQLAAAVDEHLTLVENCD